MIDKLGVDNVIKLLEAEGMPVPALLAKAEARSSMT